MVIVIVVSQLGDGKVQSVSVLKSSRPARGHGIFCRARKLCMPWARPVTLLSCELSGSFVTKWQIMCGVSPFQRKDLIKPNQQPFEVL